MDLVALLEQALAHVGHAQHLGDVALDLVDHLAGRPRRHHEPEPAQVLEAGHALGEIGRPRTVQLAALVDRGHRELPIKADFVGKNLPTNLNQSVKVLLTEVDSKDEVVVE